MFIDVQQNSEEWFELRLGKVTASTFGIFMANADKNKFGDPAQRLALKLALERITGKRTESFSNGHTERGHEQEPIARMLYEETYFTEVKNGGFFDLIEYGTSPDGLVNDDGIIEIKSVIASTHYDTFKRNNFDPSYKWQLIGHLDCTGRNWVDFVSYCSEFPENKQLLVYRIYREQVEEEIKRLTERRKEFIELIKKITKQIV